MLSKPINPNQENKRKPRPVTKKSNKPKKDNVDCIILMTYSLNEKFFDGYGKSITILGEYYISENIRKIIN